MPIYEYRCPTCEHQFELRQGYDAESVHVCPECGEIAKRRISSVPIIFKGDGWYVNDYGPKAGRRGRDDESKSPLKEPTTPKSESPSQPDQKTTAPPPPPPKDGN